MIIDAILKINPNAKVTVVGSDIDTCEIQWLEGTTPISKADIEAKIPEVRAEHDALAYARVRADAYPSLQEQFDLQYWDQVNSTTKWKEAIAKVKADNPKP